MNILCIYFPSCRRRCGNTSKCRQKVSFLLTTRWPLSPVVFRLVGPGLASQYVTRSVVGAKRKRNTILLYSLVGVNTPIDSETHRSALSSRNSLQLPYTPICYLKDQYVELSTNLAVKKKEQTERKVAVITGITGQVNRPAASTV